MNKRGQFVLQLFRARRSAIQSKGDVRTKEVTPQGVQRVRQRPLPDHQINVRIEQKPQVTHVVNDSYVIWKF
jgi:hypothetical protein